ncbi:MAG: hypothetical protein ABIJ45_10795 [Candidatus Zixiibacteriota bacterium]
MVTLSTVKYGVEIGSKKIKLIECRNLSGREKFEKIIDANIDSLNPDLCDHTADLYFSIPEPEAIIKQIHIGDNKLLDPGKRAQFEMETSLLDDNDNYYYESYPTESESERLAVAFNKKTVDDKVAWLNDHLKSPAGFKLRSLSMASAYQKYFFHETGHIICLADFNENIISYAIIKNDIPIILGAVHKNESDINDLLLDFMATIQYQLALQKNHGNSIPLSKILLSGENASTELVEKLGDRIKINTALPSPKKEFFSDETFELAVSAMAGLGLTV